MAKEFFTRHKPHVSLSVMDYLRQAGLSVVGTYQILDGHIVTSREDRNRLAAMIETEAAASGSGSGKATFNEFNIKKQTDSPHLQPEMSFTGARQLAESTFVTDLNDRMVLFLKIGQAASGQATGKRRHGPVKIRAY